MYKRCEIEFKFFRQQLLRRACRNVQTLMKMQISFPLLPQLSPALKDTPTCGIRSSPPYQQTLNPLTQIFIFTHWCHLELVSVKRAWNHFQQSLVSPSYKKLQNVTSPKNHWRRTPDLNVISTPDTRPLNNLNRSCNLHSNVWTSWL